MGRLGLVRGLLCAHLTPLATCVLGLRSVSVRAIRDSGPRGVVPAITVYTETTGLGWHLLDGVGVWVAGRVCMVYVERLSTSACALTVGAPPMWPWRRRGRRPAAARASFSEGVAVRWGQRSQKLFLLLL